MVTIGDKPWVKLAEVTDNFGKFVVEPLPRGYGQTLGNPLRRVLLSSLPGAAVTAIKIDGVAHEFSTMNGVTEDVLHIILNLKELVIKSHSDQPKTITIKAKGAGEVKAGDIEHDNEIEIINPDLVIATLDAGGKLSMEMIVERGHGYISSQQNKKASLPVGFIPTDSIFTPVTKVNIATEEIRVGQEINYDRLVLTVWTNGSIRPDEAIKESARILARHIDLFVHVGEKSEAASLEPGGKEESASGALEMSVEDLEFSSRSLNCLKKAGIKTVGELITYSEAELMKLDNFGEKSLTEVRARLSEYKLNLKGEGE
ncbi:DNA-directed RNA polymerase subunit alpha [candidate division WOR-1 bacterium RIFOXYA12_FULL_52_29]|uniref:DNA-directed RNA polymerase subunit alpha n=1 Tax=candidate division WOR-1 bacterium RIFOXYC12_FULL_54_18 TaxID=1802584 RepID=A0A1F4T5E6_UNCSA|nr:MAG: DNA-directed RNA polymerase subunit alpha [candidate division WOR-1 bacterium RIFOXYA2_FULL_51_19]OGC17565.1 MAG: DNA-directed RNA polymerase subunit alpha [candidate division WOR-1 bacterium RIFOXYA12_FULL_52_29]OGC26422.1 MAG: DNA-directed RNA polymerase subunit alpha [candidate division WOR-1 bacterium RIFOXYB2_FULL_45_9]OGC27982.1 MAG: DNA-directed RNA polymerase subunit alpha [candidate division WOR-1 bacterium RIFOXYC12_FULL_54_18]OGC29732.1 MAG: DNA-directed RNA polymerase subuni